MTPEALRALLEAVRSGATTPEDAAGRLSSISSESLGFATIDHHRPLRQGFPEVIYGEGKTAHQIATIAERLRDAGSNVLVTRVDPDKARAASEELPFVYHELARTLRLMVAPPTPTGARVALVSAGTSDLPVAEEAAETLSLLGVAVERFYDVGVAGLHRLLARVAEIRASDAVIVCAGMEGALPSVVGGLVSRPVIAVPTAVGYGASAGGFAALFTMLSSCASGVVVVNIDAGFSAAMAAFRAVSGEEARRARA